MDWLTHNVFFLVVLFVWIVFMALAIRGGINAPRSVITVTHAAGRTGSDQRRTLNIQTVCWSLGVWAAVSFLVCVLWGVATPEALHMHAFLEQILPAFTWLTWWGVVLGFIESFLLGIYVGLVFVPIYNFFSRRFEPTG